MVQKNKRKVDALRTFRGKTVLITGGTGFLGLALTKAILKENPKSIRLFSRDEVKHHKAQETLNNLKIRNFVGDIRDYSRLVKATRQADIVIHAAALKRIDLLEYNVEESIKTNIVGTLNLVNACLENNVGKAIFVSSDKACSPENTYGACKFISERIFSETNYSKGNRKTIFTIVRYGNVAESTGSVIPLFISRINNNEVIPLTDPRMTRFIITPKQVAELVFNAVRYCHGGEIFVPKLPALKIVDLIEILKKELGVKNKVKVVGIRPGEKIHELLINGSEIPRTIKYKNFYVVRSSIEQSIKNKILGYLKGRKRFRKLTMKEYSSKDHILSKKEVKKLLKKMGLI